MSEDSVYQQLRGHLGVLRLAAAAEALPGELDYATKNKLGHSAFLNRLLEVEVVATEARRRDSLERFARLPAPWRIDDYDFEAQPSVDKKMVHELATLRFLEEQNSAESGCGCPHDPHTMTSLPLACSHSRLSSCESRWLPQLHMAATRGGRLLNFVNVGRP